MLAQTRLAIVATAVLVVLLASPRAVRAHCDTMNGPVVTAARAALEKGDVTPVLRWVKADVEREVRDAFTLALAVRAGGPQAKALADRFFFETVVRLHRLGEGEPYTGLKPADAPVEPGILAADRAVATGSADDLVARVTAEVGEGLRARFAHVKAAAAHADHNLEAGRAWVAAYVGFLHYVEGLHAALAASDAHAIHTGHQEPVVRK